MLEQATETTEREKEGDRIICGNRECSQRGLQTLQMLRSVPQPLFRPSDLINYNLKSRQELRKLHNYFKSLICKVIQNGSFR